MVGSPFYPCLGTHLLVLRSLGVLLASAFLVELFEVRRWVLLDIRREYLVPTLDFGFLRLGRRLLFSGQPKFTRP